MPIQLRKLTNVHVGKTRWLAIELFFVLCVACSGSTGPEQYLDFNTEYSFLGITTLTYDCDPGRAEPRDSLICINDAGVVTRVLDTLRVTFSLTDRVAGSEGGLVWRGSGNASYSVCTMRPPAPCNIMELAVSDVLVSNRTVFCPESASASSSSSPGMVDRPVCIGHEGESLTLFTVSFPVSVRFFDGLLQQTRIIGNADDLVDFGRGAHSTTWSLQKN